MELPLAAIANFAANFVPSFRVRSPLAGLLLVIAIVTQSPLADQASSAAPLPVLLSETGLYAAGSTDITAPGLLSFSPQYPLWSDGATKRRWIYLPPGSSIDASRPDAWDFPSGTKLWKEFSLGRRIETRMIERLDDGSWRYAAFAWNANGTDAELVPPEGNSALPLSAAPDDFYVVPSESDCRACHEGNSVPVLGFSALQLSPDRDADALHAEPLSAEDVDLLALIARGLLRNLPQALIDRPPRIATGSDSERAVLGYLHGNCGHCHNDPAESGAGVPVDLLLSHYVARPDSTEDMRRSLLGTPSRFRPAGAEAAQRAEVLTLRLRSRDPRLQMPPLGTRIPDSQILSLIERWIAENPQTVKEPKT